MNQVPYGNRAFGVEAAAQTYYSKHARDLTLAESALIAGLPQAPSAYDPFVHPEAALSRRDDVLEAMLTNGDIGPRAYVRAVRQKLRLRRDEIYTRVRERFPSATSGTCS